MSWTEPGATPGTKRPSTKTPDTDTPSTTTTGPKTTRTETPGTTTAGKPSSSIEERLVSKKDELLKGVIELPLLPTKVRASIFFDGTGCNRANVAGGEDSAPFIGNTVESYSNDHSNISRLYSMWRPHLGVQSSFALYVEGVGTTNGGADNPGDAASGAGDTGILAKAAKAKEELLAKIVPPADGRSIGSVQLDLFGFSRGAAAARYFIKNVIGYQGVTLRAELRRRGVEVGPITVEFVGLFDTVAAYGNPALGGSHADDTKELGLDALAWAQWTYQLCAAEEYREYFPLTTIRSAGKRGRQVFLPGAHSDVGGSYPDGEREGISVLMTPLSSSPPTPATMNTFRQRMIKLGWYSEDQIESPNPNNLNRVRGERGKISNAYSYIPLHLMAAEARRFGVSIDPELETTFALGEMNLLSGVGELLGAYDKGIRDVTTSTPGDWERRENGPWTSLRRLYLHVSAKYVGLGAAPSWNDGKPSSGVRQRVIQTG